MLCCFEELEIIPCFPDFGVCFLEMLVPLSIMHWSICLLAWFFLFRDLQYYRVKDSHSRC